MISPDYDNGIFPNSCFFQCIQHQTDLGINITDTGKITMKQSLSQFFPNWTRLWNPVTGSQFEGRMQSGGGSFDRTINLRSNLDFVSIIHIPILFGSYKIEMWLYKTKGKKQGLIWFFLQMISKGGNGQLGTDSICKEVVRHICTFISRSMHQSS